MNSTCDRPRVKRMILLAALGIFSAGAAFGQLSQGGVALSQPNVATPAFYSIARPGELTMQVNIWGLVNHPGRYEISITTDLVQLVSYAGGPSPDAKMDAVKITRLLKTDAGITRGEYIVNMDDLYRINESSLILQPGDTIFIDKTTWSTVRDVLTVVSTFAILGATVTTIVQNTKK